MKKILNLVVLLLILLTIVSLMMASKCSGDDEPTNAENIRLLTPFNGTTDVPLTVELTWELRVNPDNKFYEYDVYLDDHTPPTTMVATHLSMSSHYVTLSPNTWYTWKVVGIDYDDGSTITCQDLWQFRTGQ